MHDTYRLEGNELVTRSVRQRHRKGKGQLIRKDFGDIPEVRVLIEGFTGDEFTLRREGEGQETATRFQRMRSELPSRKSF